jgi:hypothetical protein
MTSPSLAEKLGVECECLELDVTAILDEEGRTESLPGQGGSAAQHAVEG